MSKESVQNQCIFHVFDGLREGLSHFSPPSRVALIYAVHPDDPIRIYDPQLLLHGHEPKLKELYQDTDIWRNTEFDSNRMKKFEVHHEGNLQLAGLVSFGGRSRAIAYQMWFTEHHPDMCSTGPTERCSSMPYGCFPRIWPMPRSPASAPRDTFSGSMPPMPSGLYRRRTDHPHRLGYPHTGLSDPGCRIGHLRDL